MIVIAMVMIMIMMLMIMITDAKTGVPTMTKQPQSKRTFWKTNMAGWPSTDDDDCVARE